MRKFADKLRELREEVDADKVWSRQNKQLRCTGFFELQEFLSSHAAEIENLVRAAQAVHKEHACKCFCDSCVALSHALAALNKSSEEEK